MGQIALWRAVFFTIVYLYVKTESPLRALVGGAVAYCGCAFVGGVVPTLVVYVMPTHFPHMFADVGFIVGQTASALLVYALVYRWELSKLVARRLLHGLPLLHGRSL